MNYLKLILYSLLISFAACTGKSFHEPLSLLDLPNESGKSVSVWNEKDTATAYVFFAPDCPLCINYTLSIRELEEYFQNRSIQINLVFPGSSYDLEEINEFLEIHQLNSKVLLDRNYVLVDLLNPTVTPEVVLVNIKGRIVYQGAIDDWVYGTGLRKQNVATYYLRDAITSLLNDAEPATEFQQPYGCFIELL